MIDFACELNIENMLPFTLQKQTRYRAALHPDSNRIKLGSSSVSAPSHFNIHHISQYFTRFQPKQGGKSVGDFCLDFVNIFENLGESMGAIYKITVLKWNKHNGHIKRGHKSTLIANNFCNDAKLRAVPVTVRWLFLGILLTCGDYTRDTVEIAENVLRDMLESSWSVPRAMDALQSLQLLTYEKIEPLLIEKKRIEKKRIEKNSLREQNASQPPESAAPVIAAYCDFWKARYKAEKSPPILPQHAKQVKQLVGQVGTDGAVRLIEAYLKMPDSWFVTKRHDIPTMMGNLNAITQFVETGKLITRAETRQLDAAVTGQQTLDALRRGEI